MLILENYKIQRTKKNLQAFYYLEVPMDKILM